MLSLCKIFQKHYFIFLAFLVYSTNAFSQNTVESDIDHTIKNYFTAKEKADNTQLNELILDEAIFTFVTNENRRNEIMDKPQFIKATVQIAKKLPGTKEHIDNLNTRTDQDLAVVSADFSYFPEGKFTHCGMQVITLSKKSGKWRIASVTETRHKDQCNNPTEEEVNRFMDRWHQAAAMADAGIFFGSMAENGIYLGTDATERWTRDEMKTWAAKYFERGSAWDFKPIERKVYFSSDKQTAWFNETLNTWMGVCRGSGTLTLKAGEWKIEQYHLAVTVPNELIDGFIKLVNAPGKSK